MVDEIKMIEIPDTSKPADNKGSELAEMSDADLESNLIKEQAKFVEQKAKESSIFQSVEPGVETVTVPETTQPEEVKTEEPKPGEKQESVGQSGVVVPPAEQQTPQAQNQITLAELEKKKGRKLSPDEVAQMYANLEKEFHKRAEAVALERRVVNVRPQEAPNEQQITPNDKFKEDFYADPLGTLTTVLSIFNKPLMDNQNKLQLDKEILRLSNSPNTVDFTEPEVQEEIKQVLNEKPYLQNDLVNNLEFVYDAARSRVLRKTGKSVVEQQIIPQQQQVIPSNRKAAVVETSGKRRPPEPFNAWTSPVEDVEKRIKEIQASLAGNG